MNFRYAVIESSLRRTASRWKRLRLLQHTATLGVVVCLLALFLGAGMIFGLFTSKAVVTTLATLLAVGAFIAWIVIALKIAVGKSERTWLAGALERVNSRLLDRLNTLVFLEKRGKRDLRTHSFSLRIAKQTQGVLAGEKVPSPFSRTRPLTHLLVFVLLLTATIVVYERYSPWQRLLEAEQQAKAVKLADPEKPLELALPTTNNIEQNQSWGEVRITDPGGDMRVTKVDVVPLQIEAAANQALRKVGWSSTINGAEEKSHELPAPAEPRYAVYQPTLYLDELRLADWDVMTYYAKANTEKNSSYASEVFFLEVRPFREDILKMPGGESGKCYGALNELTTLIERQQHVIRQTHQHVQKPPEQQNLRDQDRKKLSEAEGDLSESAKHLYAKMATDFENKPIGDALDNLAKAEKSLEKASKSLGDDVMPEAQGKERTGLSELIAARKSFQKAISEHPEAFDDPEKEEAPPTAEKLNEMAEFRNESKAAQAFVDKAAEQQRQLAQRTARSQPNDFPKFADEEQKLAKSLNEFQQQHPKVFSETEKESTDAQAALKKAAQDLQKKSSAARADTQQATKQLEKLSEAMKNQSAERQLADAYKLKQMLDKEIQAFGQCEQSAGSVPGEQLQQTVADARDTLNQLKKVAEQEPTRDAFGQQLRESLNGRNKVDLDTKLNQLSLAADDASKEQRAGAAKEALSKVSKAFDESQPQAMQAARKTDALKPGEQESFDRGLQELQSLLKQLENNKQISQQDQAKQGAEALYNLQTGLRNMYGSNERGNQIMLELTRLLKGDDALDMGSLKKLMDELQHFSVETSDQLAKKEDQPELTNIDPARLPPAYRGRIQKYFQKLSEK